ncbi:MAG: DUF4271 domain-containing protein [Psychroflexus sp.]
MFSVLRTIHDHNWVVGITVFVLVLLVAIKWNKNNYFFSFLNSLFTSVFYSKKFAEKRRVEITEVLLFIASLLSISFFIYVIIYGDTFVILTYLQIFFLVTIILLSKYLIEKIIGDLFQIDQLMGRYLFYKQGVLSWLGLFFLFPLALVFYFQDINDSILLLVIVGVSILVYAIKLFSFVGLYQKHILSYWFYFILYLCTFEIAPYLILFKVIKIN